MMIHFEMSFRNEYPWNAHEAKGNVLCHMMRPAAGVARWRERPSAVDFVGTLRPRPFDKLQNGGILQGMPLVCLWAFGPLSLGCFLTCGFPRFLTLWVSPRNKAGLPNFGSCWQRFKQRTICGGCLGPQNLATSKNDPSGLYNTFWTTTYTVVKVDGSTLKRWRFVGGHDKSRLMGVASHLVSRWYSWFSN